MTKNDIYPKGTRKLVEIEFLEDASNDNILSSIYEGTPLKGDTYRVNIMYLHTIDQIKEGIKNSITETINKL